MDDPSTSIPAAFQTTQRGRVRLPPLEFWRNQTVVRGKDKEALAIVDGVSENMPPPPRAAVLATLTAQAARGKGSPSKPRPKATDAAPQDDASTPTRLDVLAQTAAAMQPPPGVLQAQTANRHKRGADDKAEHGTGKRAKQQARASPATSASSEDAPPQPKPARTRRPSSHAAAPPSLSKRTGTLSVSVGACTAVLNAIRAVGALRVTPGSGRRLRHKEGPLGGPLEGPLEGPLGGPSHPLGDGLEDSSEEEEVGEDGWTITQTEALRKWYHLLNPQLPDFWQQVANMVGRSKQECMDKHFAGVDQGALGTRSKPARPSRYLAALREDAPPPALAGRGVGPAAVRRAARTAWWAQRAEQRGLTALEDDEEEEEGDEGRDAFLADMAEQERTDRYIDNLRKRSKLLRSRGAWAAAKRGAAAKPEPKVQRGSTGADPTAIARRLLAQTQPSDEEEEEEEEYMSGGSDDEFHSMM